MNKSKSIIFQCEDCGKVLSNENNLTKHKLSHNVDNKFICDKCGLSFVKSHLLALHSCTIKSEPKTKIRSCICQTCGKTFANSSNLNKHLSLHGEKKYECSVCFKKFHLKASLHEHISQVKNTFYIFLLQSFFHIKKLLINPKSFMVKKTS